MVDLKMCAVKATVSVVAVVSLSVAGAGAATSAPEGLSHHEVEAAAKREMLCQVTSRRLTRAEDLVFKLAAHTPAFIALETKAHDRGKTNVAKYWAQVVAHRDRDVSHREARLAFLAGRDSKNHGLINGKCA